LTFEISEYPEPTRVVELMARKPFQDHYDAVSFGRAISA
jgi:hypothetical protein